MAKRRLPLLRKLWNEVEVIFHQYQIGASRHSQDSQVALEASAGTYRRESAGIIRTNGFDELCLPTDAVKLSVNFLAAVGPRLKVDDIALEVHLRPLSYVSSQAIDETLVPGSLILRVSRPEILGCRNRRPDQVNDPGDRPQNYFDERSHPATLPHVATRDQPQAGLVQREIDSTLGLDRGRAPLVEFHLPGP